MPRREANAFALSFLDCICCGFGAVILVFMIISAKIQEQSNQKLEQLASDRTRLEAIAGAGEQLLARLRLEIAQLSARSASASQVAAHLGEQIRAAERELAGEQERSRQDQAELEARKRQLAALESARKPTPTRAEQKGSQARSLSAEGDRQYLTGLRMGGRHILVLVDSSASMLDATLVNVIRMRNLPEAEQLRSTKWSQVVGTVDWLTANFPADSRFQIFRFDTQASPVLAEKGAGWLDVGDGRDLDAAVARLRETVPKNGTSLHAAFSVVASLNPRPDNVYLLADGLPTHGASPPRAANVSGSDRLMNFTRAVRTLPRGVPINVILFEMEGDPFAPDAFWKLARSTRGSFMSPSRDWP
jgi:hypothetical protein